jgi:hypothetical protein
MLPIDGSHPRQDVRPRDHPVAPQHPGIVGPGPALVGHGDVPLLDQLGDGGVLPIFIGDVVVDIIEYFAAAFLYDEQVSNAVIAQSTRGTGRGFAR